MVNPFQNLIILQLEMLRSSLILSQQIMEMFAATQKHLVAAARAGAPATVAGAAPSRVTGAAPMRVIGVEQLTRFLKVQPNGCIGPADLKS